jgi:hypothetical protein
LFIDPHFIGRLKFTVTVVSTSTSTAPLIGSVDITTGRGFIEAAAAGNPRAHTSITIAAIATRLTVDWSIIARSPFLAVNLRDSINARSIPGE